MSELKLSAKQYRWLDFLTDFQIDVQYQPGKHNILPDALLQQPGPPRDVSPCCDACLSSMVLELSYLAKVYQGQQLDVSFGSFLEKAKSADSEFVLQQIHGLSLLYYHPKTEIH